jgi:hypothetical protein
MNRYLNRRGLALLAVVLASQLLTACVIVPLPFHRRVWVGEGHPGYSAPPQGSYRDGHDDRDRGHR